VIRTTTEIVAVCAGMDKCRLPQKYNNIQNQSKEEDRDARVKGEITFKVLPGITAYDMK